MRAATTTVGLALTLAGCGAPATPGVADTAATFYRAVAQQQGALACRQLAPETRHEVAQSANAPCSAAILEEDIPEQGRMLGIERYGDQAQVRGQGDTAFLAEFPNGWKVVAVGCSPRPPLPYDCEVKS